MKIESKYNLGDKVKFIRERGKEVWHDCEFCGGSGEAIDYAGRTVDCPDCEGSGGYWDSEYVEETLEGVIEGISFDGFVCSKRTNIDVKYDIRAEKPFTEHIREKDIIGVVN